MCRWKVTFTTPRLLPVSTRSSIIVRDKTGMALVVADPYARSGKPSYGSQRARCHLTDLLPVLRHTIFETEAAGYGSPGGRPGSNHVDATRGGPLTVEVLQWISHSRRAGDDGRHARAVVLGNIDARTRKMGRLRQGDSFGGVTDGLRADPRDLISKPRLALDRIAIQHPVHCRGTTGTPCSVHSRPEHFVSARLAAWPDRGSDMIRGLQRSSQESAGVAVLKYDLHTYAAVQHAESRHHSGVWLLEGVVAYDMSERDHAPRVIHCSHALTAWSRHLVRPENSGKRGNPQLQMRCAACILPS